MAEKLFKNELPKPPAVSSAWQSGDTLGQKIEKVFVRVTQNIFLWIYEYFAELMVQIFDANMKILKPGAMRMFDPIFQKYMKEEGFPQEIKDMLQRVRDEKGESGILGLIVSAVGIFIGIFTGGLAPFARRLEHITDVIVRSYVPSASELATFNRLGLLRPEVYQKAMWNNGVGEEFKPAIEEMTRNIPTTTEIIVGRWRGVISDAEFTAYLKRMGYDDAAIKIYFELSEQIPPISDLIRFQVREAFKDDIASKFGYDNEYPAEINPYLAKQGYDVDWGKRYWRAHWTLPSPTQAYEMLHRGLIDNATLDELLKTSDYPDFWRDKLMKISYNVMTRVDIRRFLQTGVITRERALLAYKEMGYTDEIAEYQVQFAERGISSDEKDLSRADMVGMYVDGLIDASALTQACIKIGYDQQEADAILKQADFDIAKNARIDAMNYAKEQFIAGKIDKLKAQSELFAAGFSDKAVSRYLLNWERSLQSEVKGLSQADARRLFGKDIIDEQGLRDALKALKYNDASIELLVKEALQDKAESIG